MAVRTTTQFKALYGSSGTLFPDNTTAEISEGDVRAFGEDIADSFMNESDDPYTSPFPQVTASGTDTYTATLSPAITAYVVGQKFQILFTNANTGAATLNLNALGTKAITKNGSTALAAGDISAGQILVLGYDGTNLQIIGGVGITREFNRTFAETLVFDKNEIFHATETMTDDIVLQIGAGGLVNESSSMRFRIAVDGIHSISFSSGFDFLYGITNGQILDAGTYEFYLLYTNGSVSVNVPGVSAESSGAVTLSAPANFAAAAGAGDPETEIDLTSDNVTNNQGYLTEFSLTGTGGWATLDTSVADDTTSTQTGLSAGNTRFYRRKTLGDGVNFLDSAFSPVISGQTESGADTSAPTFIFEPASGVTDWTVNAPIVITANEPIRNTDGSTITSANVASRLTLKETNSGGTNIAFTATIDATKTIITITPTTMYGENQLVYVAINNVEDVNGNEVTVAISSTFTTTDYTFFNGTTNRLIFGDILDSVFAANDANFWIEVTVNGSVVSGSRILVSKIDTSANQRSFQWYFTNSDIFFAWFGLGSSSSQVRVIKWAGAMTSGEHTFVLKYDGSNDTGDGLNRLTLLKDGATVGSKTLDIGGGTWPFNIFNGTAQLAVGVNVTGSGTPSGAAYYSGEGKDFIVRSTAGSVVEINVPNLKTGLDTSGNGRDGTWV